MSENDMQTNNLQWQLQHAVTALDAGNHALAYSYFLPCAEAGNAKAQANLGLLLYMGLGINRDLPQAIKWLLQAIEQGRGDAAHNLATLYLTCEPELPRRPEESRKLYLKARELGFIVAPDEWYEQLIDE